MALGSIQPLNRNGHQGCLVGESGVGGLKGGRPVRRADNLTTSMCRLSSNSGSLNLLEPQGPVQACNALVLPLGLICLQFTAYPHPL